MNRHLAQETAYERYRGVIWFTAWVWGAFTVLGIGIWLFWALALTGKTYPMIVDWGGMIFVIVYAFIAIPVLAAWLVHCSNKLAGG